MMQATLKVSDGPNVCWQCKVKLPEGHYKTRCHSCLTKQQSRAMEVWWKWKFEELENVLLDGQGVAKKPGAAKVCANWHLVTENHLQNLRLLK